MTNEEFLQRYDSGKLHFTKYEIKKMAYGEFGNEFGNYVTTAEGETHRWYQEVETIFEVGDRLFAVSWDRGLTEQQENDFDDAEVYEVERKEKVIFIYVRKDTHD